MATSPPFPSSSLANTVNDMELKLKHLGSENLNLLSEREKLRQEHWQVRSQYAEQNQQLQIVTEAKTKLEDKIKSFLQQQNKEIDRLNNKIGNYKIKAEELQNNLDQVKTDNEALKGKIASLPTEDDLNKLRSEFQESIDIKQNSLKEKCSEIDKLEKALGNEREKCVTQHDNIVKLQGELNSAQSDVKRFKNTISEKESEIGENKNKMQEMTLQLEESKEIIAEKENEIKDQSNIITGNLKEKQATEEKVQMLTRQLHNFDDKNRSQKTSLETKEKFIEDLESQNARLVRKVEENKGIQKELDDKNAEILEQEKKLEIIISKNENDKRVMDNNLKFWNITAQNKNDIIGKLNVEREKMLGFLQVVRLCSEFPGNENNDPIENQLEEFRVHVQEKFQTFKIVYKFVDALGQVLIQPTASASSVGNQALPSSMISQEKIDPLPIACGSRSLNYCVPNSPDLPQPTTSSNIPENITTIDPNALDKEKRQGKNVKRKSGQSGRDGEQAGGPGGVKYLILDGPGIRSKLLWDPHHFAPTIQQKSNLAESRHSDAVESGNDDFEVAMETATSQEQKPITLRPVTAEKVVDPECIDLTDD